METEETLKELKRLDFEDILWLVFGSLALINIIGDANDKEFLKTNDNKFKNRSNQIFEFTLIVTFFIYIYFLQRNFKAFKKAPEEEKNLFSIKLLGSSLLLAGIICLIYFQTKETSFIGAPAL